MKSLEIINVSNGSDNYPGNFTIEEIKIINRYKKGYVLNLFSGRSTIGDLRVDYSCKEATNNCDVFDFLYEWTMNQEPLPKIDTIILDPPYNKRFADKYQKMGNTNDQFVIFTKHINQTSELFDYVKKISPKIIILKSWNYYIIKGYKLKKGFLCYAGGYRKSTILLIMEKITRLDEWNLKS